MPDDATLTPEEAAVYLQVNPQTIYRNLRKGILPGAKIGRQWRIRRADLQRLLAGASPARESLPSWETGTQNEERRALLRSELERLTRIAIGSMKPLAIYVFGSYAQGEVGDWSDLDLVIVAGTDLPFFKRSKAVIRSVRPRVGLDVLVYTPAEWQGMKERPFVRREILERGTVLYER